jgi:hypothetical protein
VNRLSQGFARAGAPATSTAAISPLMDSSRFS